MKFSILIPVYNVELYLSRCLDSILAQQVSSYEVILVNDGSTDSSAAICDHYVQLYPQQFQVIHKRNEGLLSARRIGLSHAKGEYVCFLDSDDYWHPHFLKVLGAELIKHNPDIIAFGYSLVGDAHRILEASHPTLQEGLYEQDSKYLVYEALVKDTSLNSLCTKCVRRTIIDIDRDYSSMYHISMGEDLLQSLPIFDAAESILVLHAPLYNYYQNEKSITQSKLKIYTINSTVTVLQELETYALKWGCNLQNLHQRLGLSVVFIMKQLILYRFGRYGHSREERSHIIERLKQDDIKAFSEGYVSSSDPLSLKLCFLSFRKKWYAVFQFLIASTGLLYNCKKHCLVGRKGNKV